MKSTAYFLNAHPAPFPRQIYNADLGVTPELKAKASAIIDDVKGRRFSYAVRKRGRIEALIFPSDAGERLLNQSDGDNAWEQVLIDQLLNESRRKKRSAGAELARMRR